MISVTNSIDENNFARKFIFQRKGKFLYTTFEVRCQFACEKNERVIYFWGKIKSQFYLWEFYNPLIFHSTFLVFAKYTTRWSSIQLFLSVRNLQSFGLSSVLSYLWKCYNRLVFYPNFLCGNSTICWSFIQIFLSVGILQSVDLPPNVSYLCEMSNPLVFHQSFIICGNSTIPWSSHK